MGQTKELSREEAISVMKKFPFVIYQIAEVIKPETLTAVTLTGTPDEVLENLEKYKKAGVDLPILSPIGDIQGCWCGSWYNCEAQCKSGKI